MMCVDDLTKGTIADTFSKKVNVLLVKDETVNNEKVKKAKAAGIPVLTTEEFILRY